MSKGKTRYKHPVGAPRWKDDEIAMALLRLRSKARDERAFLDSLVKLSIQLGRGTGPKDMGLVRRKLWGLARRYGKDFEGGYEGKLTKRPPKYTDEWRPGEVWFLKQAIRATKIDDDLISYISALLQRHPKDVKEAINKYGPAKGRTAMFDL